MPPRIVDGFDFTSRVGFSHCLFCSIGNITGRTTLRNQEDAKERRLKQSRPTFAAQEGLVDFRGRRQQCGNAVSERNFRQGCRLGAARSAALHEKHANLGYASLTSCLKSPRRGQRPSICEELVLGNSTLKKPTWANAELYGGNHSHRAFQTHISTVFVHDIGFPRKRGRVGGLPNDDASTHFGGRTRGGRLAGWRAAGLRLAGWRQAGG